MKEPVLRTKTVTSSWNKRVKLVLRAVGGLQYLRGNKLPYFSLTKEEYRKGFPNQCQSFGADHEIILKHWPELADLAALHLSDINGVPMHADADSWYWLCATLPHYAGEKYHGGNVKANFPKPEGAPRRDPWDNTDYREYTSDECLDVLAKRVRMSLDDVRVLRDQVVGEWNRTRNDYVSGDEPLTWGKESWTAARQWFSRWIEEQKPRWKAEADACIQKHGLQVFGDKWEVAAK